MTDTIAAIATAPMDAAISVIRVSGPDAIADINKIASVDLTKAEGYTLHYGTVNDAGEAVDDVLFAVYRAPKSYTGEDSVEISCHGGVYITRRILSLVLGTGIRMARRGEFTERAFLNGKMDLSQAEGVNDLIRSKDEVNAASAMHAVKGSVKHILEPLLDQLTQIVAQIEVNIDYPEYDDVPTLVNETLLPEVQAWIRQCADLIRTADQAVFVRNGINTVILGRPNVGKSSLLNALLEEDKAIVTDIAGTTRDLVEGSVRLGSLTLNLIDTAGIREARDKVEQIGIEKSLDALKKADLAIVVLDATAGITAEDQKILDAVKDRTHIVVYNKKDEKDLPGTLSISALNKDIQPLIDEIERLYQNGILSAKSDTLNNERQIGLARQAADAMRSAEQELKAGASPDLVTVDLQNAWEALKEITGDGGKEQLMDEIFSRFCLGK